MESFIALPLFSRELCEVIIEGEATESNTKDENTGELEASLSPCCFSSDCK